MIASNKLFKILLILVAFIFPWSIMFATPQFHIGFWGQVEGMIVFNHFASAFVALLLLLHGIYNIEFRKVFVHPLVLLPSIIGFYSIISSLLQRLPVLSLYGSPQLGQGAFGYFSLSLLTALYFTVLKNDKVKILYLINFIIIITIIFVGSFYPSITGVVISFFGFTDWLALYLVGIIIYVICLLEIKNTKIDSNILAFLLFLVLGPFFWKIDNNSAIALWILISFAWFFWSLNYYYRIKIKYFHEIIYSPLFFTFIPILLSVLMLLSSFIFWDGETDMTDQITDSESWGHLATMIARGSIVRVLFEHLVSIKAILFGYGWGSISELLLKSFSPEVFYQINTGNRVHFHTHNEIFEHIFSIGIIGAFIYVAYIYNIFKYAFKFSLTISFCWLLYFCIGAFWFQWTSNIPIQAMLAAFLLVNCHEYKDYILSSRIINLFSSIYFYSIYLVLICIFLLYGAYIGYYTAYNHSGSYRAEGLINISKESKITGNCSKGIYDFGKGGFQFSQKFNGFSNYFKDQVMLFGSLNETDYDVLEWNLCASHEFIINKNASLELINVHINTLSMLSVLPGEFGEESRNRMKKYVNLWENKLKRLLTYAPKRVDQATPLISYYLTNNNDIGVKSICSFINRNEFYQGFCDLAIGSIYLKEGRLEEGIILLERANRMGVLDSNEIDMETSRNLKTLIKKYKN